MKRTYIAYGLLGGALWPVPLLNVLQVESAAVVACVSYFVAGTAAIRAFRNREAHVGRVLLRQEVALLIPLGMLLTAQLWAPNCTLGQGLLFYALFPGVTVVFAVALSYLLTAVTTRWAGWIHAGVGIAVALAGPVYDLGLHPQFYTYNHVFGGVLGPIYDEQLAVRDGLFVFRGLTLLWAGAALLAGRLIRGRHGGVLLTLCLCAIGGVYAFASPLGINTTPATLRAALGGHHQTTHFDLYYDPEQLSAEAVEALAQDHETSYRYIRDRLDLASPAEGPRIQSYLYPTPDVKARLTGARTTSVAPVWLKTPQVHLLTRRAEASLGHELAHVLSRRYGLPGLRASWAPGLVEGWAVALEPPRPAPSAHDLVSAVPRTDSTQAFRVTPAALADRLTPWGFWTGRGAVSYAAVGSFVDYLLRAYGAERLKEVYAWADFEAVYGRSLPALSREWRTYLRNRSVISAAAYEVATRQFTRPSLFETTCPHHVPAPRQRLQAARRSLRKADTTAATDHLQQALAQAPELEAAHVRLADLRLSRGRAAAVRQQIDTLSIPLPARLHRRLGDAYALQGQPRLARAHYAQARTRVPRYAHDMRGRLSLRDAIASRPAVVRVLTSAGSAARQARRLARLGEGGALTAWRVVRLLDAHQASAAAAQWEASTDPVPTNRPRAWRQAWGVQWRAWGAEAMARAGQIERARRTARRGAREARALGAQAWARTLQRWGAHDPDGSKTSAARSLGPTRPRGRTRRQGDGSQSSACDLPGPSPTP